MSYEDHDEDISVGSFTKDVGSFPKGFGYGDGVDVDLIKDKSPRILLMGLRRSGKSSIEKVVFQKMSPNETLFLESTQKVIKDDVSNSPFVNFQLWDMPAAQIDFYDVDAVFSTRGSIIFVIDAQDEYLDALNKLNTIVVRAYKVNPSLKFEVFIHKVDGLTEDSKMETQRDIMQRVSDDLSDTGLDRLHLSFHLTSIYDHSVFEAFSKVVQKLIPYLPTMENLLNILISNSAIEKAFLFDVISKMYIATDSSPVDIQSYELCCDMIDLVIDSSCIYGVTEDSETSAFDNNSYGLIHLNNGTILYMKEVSNFLALVCILREDNFERQGVVDYNVSCFRDAIQKLLALMNKKKLEGEKQSDIMDTVKSRLELNSASLPT